VTRTRRVLIGGLLTGLAVFGLASPAFAHDVLVSSNPAQNAQLATGPTTVELTFDAPVQNGPNVITVIGPQGGHWEQTSNATVDGNSVSTSVAPLGPAGVYTIGYRVISADGHPVQGEVKFTLTRAGTGRPVSTGTAATTAAGSGGSGGVPVWVWIVGVLVLLGIGVFVVLRMSRRTEDARS
jgi:methionine-rich copper-binding protein CopC